MVGEAFDDVYAFYHRPLTKKEADAFEKHLKDSRRKRKECSTCEWYEGKCTRPYCCLYVDKETEK